VNKNQVHAWRIEISTPSHLLESQEFYDEDTNTPNPHHNSTSTQEDILGPDVPFQNRSATMINGLPSIITTLEKSNKRSFLNISIAKIAEQVLVPGTDVSFSSCTGHFVCGSSYALISTTKECVKLWKLQKRVDGIDPPGDQGLDGIFKEWNSLAACKEKGQLLQASAAYSGRIACVYKLDKKKIEEKEKNSAEEDKLTRERNGDLASTSGPEEAPSCAVTVYECESTGGTEWLLEDTIELNTDEEVVAVHLEWIPKHDAQHILALAISDMVCAFLKLLNNLMIHILLVYNFVFFCYRYVSLLMLAVNQLLRLERRSYPLQLPASLNFGCHCMLLN